VDDMRLRRVSRRHVLRLLWFHRPRWTARCCLPLLRTNELLYLLRGFPAPPLRACTASPLPAVRRVYLSRFHLRTSAGSRCRSYRAKPPLLLLRDRMRVSATHAAPRYTPMALLRACLPYASPATSSFACPPHAACCLHYLCGFPLPPAFPVAFLSVTSYTLPSTTYQAPCMLPCT